MKKNYLPSKQFIIRVIIIAVLVAIVFGVYGVIKFFKNRAEKAITESQTPLLVGDIIQKDSNSNGIPDWEEYLWGLDPQKDGESNKKFIDDKKKMLTQQNDISLTDNKTLTENELMSREFFATIVALQESNSISPESIQSISDAIGKKIEASPIPDTYTKEMLIIKSTSDSSISSYHEAFKTLATKYQDKNIGDELSFISQGIQNKDPQALYVAQMVASSYSSFGKDLINTPVPSSLSDIHLSLANNYEKTAQSIEGLTQILIDPVTGMKSLINYKRYSDALVSDIENLSGSL